METTKKPVDYEPSQIFMYSKKGFDGKKESLAPSMIEKILKEEFKDSIEIKPTYNDERLKDFKDFEETTHLSYILQLYSGDTVEIDFDVPQKSSEKIRVAYDLTTFGSSPTKTDIAGVQQRVTKALIQSGYFTNPSD